MPTLLTCVAKGASAQAAFLISLFLQDSRHEATLEMWQETYVSALLRAILYSDDATYFLDAYRKLDPIPTPEGEIRFLQAAEALFSKGESHHYCCGLFL